MLCALVDYREAMNRVIEASGIIPVNKKRKVSLFGGSSVSSLEFVDEEKIMSGTWPLQDSSYPPNTQNLVTVLVKLSLSAAHHGLCMLCNKNMNNIPLLCLNAEGREKPRGVCSKETFQPTLFGGCIKHW